MKTAVLIPCYNEAKTIGRVVADFKEKMPHADIYVYDNNSTDNTAELAEQAGAIVRYEHKQGKGNVVRTMFREVDADCYVMVDGDDTYPADFGPRLEQLVLSGKLTWRWETVYPPPILQKINARFIILATYWCGG